MRGDEYPADAQIGLHCSEICLYKGQLVQVARTFLGSEASSRTRMPLSILAQAVTRNTMRQPSSLTECLSPILVAKKPPAVAPAKHESACLLQAFEK